MRGVRLLVLFLAGLVPFFALSVALERKGLIRSMYPHGAVVTTLGLDYETGLRETILHKGGH